MVCGDGTAGSRPEPEKDPVREGGEEAGLPGKH
jgi:hypothetical protein